MLEIGIDEFTLVLSPVNEPDEWSELGEELIDHFVQKAHLLQIFGDPRQPEILPAGYTTGITYGEHDFYFSIAINPEFPRMGIVIKFSAQAWSYYRATYRDIFKQDMYLYSFYIMTQSPYYNSRLSRVDLVIDFLDEKLSVNTIYKQLIKKNHVIKNQAGRTNHSSISAVVKDNIASTVYVGSKGRNIRSLLRIYDKRLEQITKFGHYLDRALSCQTWVRFEVSLRGLYAHDFTGALPQIKTEEEFGDLIVSAITDRYQFFYKKSGQYTNYTKKMMLLIQNRNFSFSSPSARNNLLEQSQAHILKGSGLFPYLYKVFSIWGQETLQECIKFLIEEFYDYEPNDDVIGWINKYKSLYLKQGIPFKSRSSIE